MEFGTGGAFTVRFQPNQKEQNMKIRCEVGVEMWWCVCVQKQVM